MPDYAAIATQLRGIAAQERSIATQLDGIADQLAAAPVEPPIEPPVIPPTQPPAGGQQLVWNPTGNSRVFIGPVHAGDHRSFWFRTPTAPDKHVFNCGEYSHYEATFKDFEVKDGTGKVLAKSHTQTGVFTFGAGLPPETGFTKTYIPLALNTVYYLTVSTPICSTQCDYYIDINNA